MKPKHKTPQNQIHQVFIEILFNRNRHGNVLSAQQKINIEILRRNAKIEILTH